MHFSVGSFSRLRGWRVPVLEFMQPGISPASRRPGVKNQRTAIGATVEPVPP